MYNQNQTGMQQNQQSKWVPYGGHAPIQSTHNKPMEQIKHPVTTFTMKHEHGGDTYGQGPNQNHPTAAPPATKPAPLTWQQQDAARKAAFQYTTPNGAPIGTQGFFHDPYNGALWDYIDNTGKVAYNVGAPKHNINAVVNPFKYTGGAGWLENRGFTGTPAAHQNSYVGPWLTGFDATGTDWMPMGGGGWLNTRDGRSWSAGQGVPGLHGNQPSASTSGQSFEQQLYDSLMKSILGM
jgi:hypothetical protein